MIKIMIICGLVLLISITSTKILYKFGVPILLIFIILGMIFGSDGIVGIYFNDYQLTNKIAIIALIFIMFLVGSVPIGRWQSLLQNHLFFYLH